MKRDMDLVREMLLALEADGGRELVIEGFTKEQIRHHCHIMGEAGLLGVVDQTNLGSERPEAVPTHITWEGHEFLDAAREQTRWEQARSTIRSAGGASFKIWIAVLTDLVKKGVGL